MKLVGNFTFMSYVETVSEALALADAGGLSRSSVTTFLDRIFPGFVTKGGATTPHLKDFQTEPSQWGKRWGSCPATGAHWVAVCPA